MEPIYCRQCRAAISRDATFCPVCGRDQRAAKDAPKETPQTPAPVQNDGATAALNREANRFVIVVFAVIGVLMASCFYVVSRPSSNSDPAKDAATLHQNVENLISAIGPDAAALRWETHGSSTVRLYAPGPVSEYEAQRLAKSFSDRLPVGVTVRVYDNVGIQRAQEMRW